jgi:hypothetical protein
MQFRWRSTRRRAGTTTTERRRPSTSAPKDGEAARVNRTGRKSAMLPHAPERPLLPKQPEDKGRDGTNTAAIIYIVVLVIGGIWLFSKLIR